MASVTCPSCQTQVAAGTPSCPSCGSSLAGIRPTGAGPQMRFNSSSLTQTDRIVGTATIVLFIALFLPWFSVNIGIGTVSADGLSAHGYLYLTLFLSLGVIGMLVASATGAWSLPATSPIAREQLLLIATAINFVLVLLGFVLKPGGSGVGWTFGAFIALAAAVVAAAPLGLPAIRARRGK